MTVLETLLAGLVNILMAGVPIILAITLHESAHGYAALAMGDDTAKAAGRLSLNPIRHIDRFGTIILPAVLVIGQLLAFRRILFLFGWAKPVPVAAWKFHDPRRGMAIVAAAGPAMNFFLAWLGALALYLPGAYAGFTALVFERAPPGAQLGYADLILGGMIWYFILANLVLGLFNLIPIPPLDGGRVAVGLLPAPLAFAYARLERLGILIVLLVFFLLPALLKGSGIAFDPIQAVLGRVLPAAVNLVLFLAGHHV